MNIEYETLERARENMESAFEKFKDAPPQEKRTAWEINKERSSDYRSFLKVAYNL